MTGRTTRRRPVPSAVRPAVLGLVAVLGLAVVAAACTGGDGSTSTTARAGNSTGAGTADGRTAVASIRPSTLPRNRYLGPPGRSTMHGDAASSDTTPLPGPGTGPVEVVASPLGAVCPTIVVGRDGLPVALCTRVADLRPVVHLLDPRSGASLASLELVAGGLFGGVYGYLDHHDRLVVADGTPELLRIAHRRDGTGWTLSVDQRVPLGGDVDPGDAVVGLSPDVHGGVWFATAAATVGLVDTATGVVHTTVLGSGERIANSISTARPGVLVATDHAVHLLARGDDGRPRSRWRVAYDRGPGRKPGQLSWGTGSTPTFFGPTDGADYAAFVDNASPQVHLVVVRTTGPRAGRRVCDTVVLRRGGPGSENSPIGIDRTVVVASTYGTRIPGCPTTPGPACPPAPCSPAA